MGATVLNVQPLQNFKLKIDFTNGSIAIVALNKRVRAMRFRVLSDPDLFFTARAEGDRVSWSAKGVTFSAFVHELLDCMLMD